MGTLAKLFTNLSISQRLRSPLFFGTNQQLVRTYFDVNFDRSTLPTPGKGQLRRQVFFPENNKYTVKPLETKHLAGRDPVSGRKIVQGLGGGVRHKCV